MIPRALRLAAWLLPPDARGEVLADLVERHAIIAATEGAPAAARWARRQPWVALVARLRWQRPTEKSARPPRAFSGVVNDLAVAVGSLARRPGVTLAVLATVATAIASLSVIAAVIDAVLLRPLPYPDADRLVWVKAVSTTAAPSANPAGWSNPNDVADWNARAQTLTALAAFETFDGTVMAGSTAVRVSVAQLHPTIGAVLGIHAAVGRLFTPADAAPGTHVLVFTDAFWRRYFSADPTIVGRSVTFAGLPFEVIGVLPPLALPFPTAATDIWTPLAPVPPGAGDGVRGGVWQRVVGRIRPDRTLAEARADLAAVGAALAVQYARTNKTRAVLVEPYRDGVVGSTRDILRVLGGAVAIFLLIACANVGHLLLVAAEARRRELAVRAALGASTWRIARLMLVESLLLSTAGGLIGLALASPLLRAFLTLYPDPLPSVGAIAIGRAAIGVAALGTLVASAVSALPALLVVRSTDVQISLKNTERGLGSAREQRVRTLLVVTQIAMSTALLIGGALLSRTFWDMSRVKAGFNPDHLLSFNVALPDSRYGKVSDEAAFFARLSDRLRAIPGVASAGATTLLPFAEGEYRDGFSRIGTADAYPNLPIARLQTVTPGYLETLGVPLDAGRIFTAADSAEAPSVVVLNRTAERMYFPGGAVGHRIEFQGEGREIVGVVGDKHHRDFRENVGPDLYVPRAQTTSQRLFGWLLLRTVTDPRDLGPAVLAAVRAVDPEVSVAGLETMNERIAGVLAPDRFRAVLVGALAAASLLLSAIGIYGVVAYAVALGARQIAIRMALGADAGRTARGVVQRVMLLSAVGTGLGVAVSYLGATLLEDFLTGVTVHDPTTILSVVAILFAVAVLAASGPARRASRIDPTSLLRAN